MKTLASFLPVALAAFLYACAFAVGIIGCIGLWSMLHIVLHIHRYIGP